MMSVSHIKFGKTLFLSLHKNNNAMELVGVESVKEMFKELYKGYLL